MEIRRTGNFGFIDTGEGQLISFAMGKGWAPSSINFSRPDSWQTKKIELMELISCRWALITTYQETYSVY